MMILGMIGPFQLIFLLVIAFVFLGAVFALGYSVGKKAGYIKRVKEVENK